jgi:HK97 family phage major capsid protein
MTIEQLRALLKELAAQCKTMLEEAEASDSGVFDEEQQAKFDALTEKADGIKAQIERKEKAHALYGDIDQPAGRQTDPATPGAGQDSRAAVVEDNEDPMAGFQNMADFALAVRSSYSPGTATDERLLAAPSNFMQESGGTSQEGFEVPVAMRQTIWELVYGDGLDLLSMVDSEPTAGNQVQMPADTDTPWSGNGVQARWRNEASQMTGDKFATEGRDVKLHELYAFILATEELLEDAPRLNTRLTRKAAEAIRWKSSEAIMNGTGVGQPLGYRHADGPIVNVAKEGSQSADTVVAANVAKMYSRMLPSSLPRAVWLANSDVLPQLITMTLGDQPIWTPPNQGMTQAPNGLLLGRPIIFTEHAETVGDLGDIQLVDPMGYYLARKQSGVQFAESIHLFFDYNLRAFRWTFRLGGQPHLQSAVSPNNGTAKKSHFVQLAART